MTFRPSFLNFCSLFVSIPYNDSNQLKLTLCGGFGGNRFINGRDSAIFMPNFGRFRRVGIMTQNAFRPSFFNYCSFFVSTLQNNSNEPKITFCGGLEEIGP